MPTSHFKTRTACPICEAPTFRTIYERPYDAPPIRDYVETFYASRGRAELQYLTDEAFVLCECDACRAIFQRDIPGDTLMARLYGHWIDPDAARDRHLAQDDLAFHASHVQEIMQIISYLGRPPGSLHVLDFGMGWGKWALMARAFSCEAYGSEFSRDRIAHARSLGIKVVEADEIPAYAFDFINTEQVFEHLPEPLATLRHLKKGLGTNGLIKISVPNSVDIDRRLKIMDWTAPKGTRNSLNPVAPLEHINLFRRSSLAAMAHKAGMELTKIPMRTQYRFTTDWGGLERTARKGLLPIQRNVLARHNYVFLRHRRDGTNGARG